MKHVCRTRLAAAVLFLISPWAACAEGADEKPGDVGSSTTTKSTISDSGGAGGAGAQGGAAANGGSSQGGGGGSGGATNNCGNGKLEPGESCDGTDFGGKSCEDYGLGSGNLKCNSYCSIVVSGCGSTEVLVEAICEDFSDDDNDGYLDCDDSDCQPTASCVPGVKKVGADCFAQNECAATSKSDPVCLFDWPDGYCSEFCDLMNDDCPAGAVCANLGLSVNGVCLDSCTVDADCRSNYSCQNKGLVTEVCMAAPESQCNDALDNDGNGLTDCEDASCQALPACSPGVNAVGAACGKHSDCQANANDPVCFDAMNYFWPDGYCSEFCDAMNPDCPSGSVCFKHLPSLAATCLDSCAQASDCRTGYQCKNIGAPTLVCAL